LWGSYGYAGGDLEAKVGFTVQIDDSGPFVRVTIEGEVSAEMARDFSLAANAEGAKLAKERYLFDARQSRNMLSAADNYYFAYHDMNEMKLNRAARSAILVAADDTSHNFVETVSQNAGFNVRIFTDEPTALAWLLDGD